MLEERFQSLALLTTRGFRHVLEIARQSVPSGYGNSYFWVGEVDEGLPGVRRLTLHGS